ncbi:UDP-glycosyltransferase 73E1-like protein [Tanacetum coccineum]
MDALPTDLHFVMFPLMAQGHMVPLVDMARILAQRGATVTIITTPLLANRFRPVISRAIDAKLKIQLLELKLPLAEVGLPEGCESFDTISLSEVWAKLTVAIEMLEKPAEDLLRGLCPPPDCMISDFLFPWSTNVANSCRSCPILPNRVEVEADQAAYGILVHTCEELEPEYVREFSKARDKKVWCIGPVSQCNENNLDIAERGNKAVIEEHDCLKWLGEKEPESVLYVCLGSLASVSTQQAIELGLGLESTNRPFIWCIRNQTDELDKWFVEFEERVRDRGLIVHGWAPQVLILSHRAIGGFLTHCGWNSTLESTCAGVPMVTWPFFADQFFNEIFIVEILKIGVRIGVEIPVPFGEQDMFEVLVKTEDVKTAVEYLMQEDEEGKQRRKRARELGKMAKTAMAQGGSSYVNVSSLIQDIETFKTQH